MKLQGTKENIKIASSYLATVPPEIKQKIEKAIDANPTPLVWSLDGTVLETGVMNCNQFVKRPALKIFIHSQE